MGRSNIEWTDYAWNPVSGCSPISAGCAHCYAERMATRLAGRAGYPVDKPFQVTLHPERLSEPLKWRKKRRVFVCSMGDLFHDDVPFEFIDRVFAVMASCGNDTFILLTKRPERMLAYYERVALLGKDAAARYERELREHFEKHRGGFRAGYTLPDPPTPELRHIYDSAAAQEYQPPMTNHGFSGGEYHWRRWPLDNVWVGVSVEDQPTADARIPLLLRVPAVVHWVSYEPALGRVNFKYIKWAEIPVNVEYYRSRGVPAPDKMWSCNNVLISKPGNKLNPPKIGLDWIVAGGETGPGARPAHPRWFESTLRQCQEAQVPFFFKSWGDWAPRDLAGSTGRIDGCFVGDRFVPGYGNIHPDDHPDNINMVRVGKKRAGRLLNGCEWNQHPTPF